MDTSDDLQQPVVPEETGRAAEAAVPPETVMPLPEELMSSVLAFLRMKDMLQWRAVTSSTKVM